MRELDPRSKFSRRFVLKASAATIPAVAAAGAISVNAGRAGGGALRAASLTTLLNMVAAGYGTTLIPGLAAGAAHDTGLVLRPLSTPVGRTVRIASRTQFPRHAAVAAVGDIIAARLDGFARGGAAGVV